MVVDQSNGPFRSWFSLTSIVTITKNIVYFSLVFNWFASLDWTNRKRGIIMRCFKNKIKTSATIVAVQKRFQVRRVECEIVLYLSFQF